MLLAQNLLVDFAVPHACPSHASSEELAQDVRLLIHVLHRAYPAQWVMPSSAWQKVIDQLQALSEKQRGVRISVEQFGSALADILWAIPDGHLKVCRGEVPFGSLIQKNDRQPSTGNNIAGEDEVWRVEFRESAQGSIPVVGISWFPQPSETQWTGFLEKVSQLLRYPALIFDLRGNRGGNDTKAIEATSLLLDRKLDLGWLREVICESAEAYALQMNTYSSMLWSRYYSKGLTAPQRLIDQWTEFDATMRRLEANMTPPAKLTRQAPLADGGLLGPGSFRGKIYVLIDGKTGSSGEWAALYLKRHPNTRLVGENTYGMIHFGNSGRLRLPNSGLEITLCMKINELVDGRFFEKTGIPPDIRNSSRDSLEFALTLI